MNTVYVLFYTWLVFTQNTVFEIHQIVASFAVHSFLFPSGYPIVRRDHSVLIVPKLLLRKTCSWLHADMMLNEEVFPKLHIFIEMCILRLYSTSKMSVV